MSIREVFGASKIGTVSRGLAALLGRSASETPPVAAAPIPRPPTSAAAAQQPKIPSDPLHAIQVKFDSRYSPEKKAAVILAGLSQVMSLPKGSLPHVQLIEMYGGPDSATLLYQANGQLGEMNVDYAKNEQDRFGFNLTAFTCKGSQSNFEPLDDIAPNNIHKFYGQIVDMMRTEFSPGITNSRPVSGTAVTEAAVLNS